MTEQRDSSGSAFVRALGSFFRFLVRLFFVVVLGALIGAGLFYGVPWAYRRLTWPVQENSARIAILEDQVAKNSESIFDNHRALQDRIVTLETEIAELQEAVTAQVQDQEALKEQVQGLAPRITALEEDLQAQRQDIEQVQAGFTATASDLEEEIGKVQEQLDEAERELSQQIEMSEETVEENVSDLQGQLDRAVARLSLLQTAEGLLKVRLLLVEENPGSARDALGLAISHLAQASDLMPSQAEALDDLRERMLAVDELIAQGSFRARPTLEALWADVMGLAAPLAVQSTVTETQATSPLSTPTATP